MENYYQEIEQYIKRNEVNKLAREIEENQDTLTVNDTIRMYKKRNLEMYKIVHKNRL